MVRPVRRPAGGFQALPTARTAGTPRCTSTHESPASSDVARPLSPTLFSAATGANHMFGKPACRSATWPSWQWRPVMHALSERAATTRVAAASSRSGDGRVASPAFQCHPDCAAFTTALIEQERQTISPVASDANDADSDLPTRSLILVLTSERLHTAGRLLSFRLSLTPTACRYRCQWLDASWTPARHDQSCSGQLDAETSALRYHKCAVADRLRESQRQRCA